ncbi:MAG: DUF1614 domain-containing protein [Dehalococcoidales bacterium]|jgi:uncharacterized membrane protein|nr:DUF1614 domain-containing protein [Dehalococcoidales bacterium]
MGCLALLLPIIVILPIVIFLLLFNIITVSYAKLGLSESSAIILLVSTLIGGFINIPVSRRRIVLTEPQPLFSQFFFYTPPRVATQTVAVNVGGAIIPVAFAIYLIPRADWLATLIATLAVIVISRLIARPVPGMGIVMPAFVPPLVSAGLAFLLARDNPAPVAYISGTLGTLIGADLLNWPNFKKLGAHMISIGGAGVFDGIFLAGILAVLLASI